MKTSKIRIGGAHLDTVPNGVARQEERRPPARHLSRSSANGTVPEAGAPGTVSRSAPMADIWPLTSWGCAALLLILNSTRALFGADSAAAGQIDHVLGYRRRMTQICRSCGKFRPRLIGNARAFPARWRWWRTKMLTLCLLPLCVTAPCPGLS